MEKIKLKKCSIFIKKIKKKKVSRFDQKHTLLQQTSIIINLKIMKKIILNQMEKLVLQI